MRSALGARSRVLARLDNGLPRISFPSMLSPLLVALLGAAPDSVALPDLLAQRAADSAALERISPLPAPMEPPPPAAPRRQPPRSVQGLPDSASPLVPRSVGLGFRVLGSTPRLHLQVATTPSNFLRLGGAFASRLEEERRSLTRTTEQGNGLSNLEESEGIDVEQRSTNWEVQLSLGGLGLCQGSLCGTWSVGPFMGREIVTTENVGIQSTLDYQFRERSVLKRLGVAGTLGLRWEFREGLALAADLGGSWAMLSGERKTQTKYDVTDETTSSRGEPDGSEISLGFVGLGLDAWF